MRVGGVPLWTEYFVVASTLEMIRRTCQAASLLVAQRPMIQKSVKLMCLFDFIVGSAA